MLDIFQGKSNISLRYIEQIVQNDEDYKEKLMLYKKNYDY